MRMRSKVWVRTPWTSATPGEGGRPRPRGALPVGGRGRRRGVAQFGGKIADFDLLAQGHDGEANGRGFPVAARCLEINAAR